ncbi:hypothetical protein B0J11DRAFT_557347 [Dendryphion nanum]|uniref:Nonribosomal peptide synthetase 12 n=1 Tax=Dendryphion nanum TaxID=256645 RepID=A0A9P9E560_9PLEO|nr:hypothetical protein B0J11DRAFT_557347 [Dendryphion nanum]
MSRTLPNLQGISNSAVITVAFTPRRSTFYSTTSAKPLKPIDARLDEISLHTDSTRWSTSYIPHILEASSSSETLRNDSSATPLPPKLYWRVFRNLRWTLFTAYQRLFGLVFIMNAIGFAVLLSNPFQLDHLATAASANLLLALIVRQDFFVKIIFGAAWHVPWSVPLRIRLLITRIYTYGGIHSGAAIAGTLWLLAFTVILTIRSAQQGLFVVPVLVLTWVLSVILSLICILAFPSIRSAHHNTFERTHRFLGWSSILVFWAQLILQAHYTKPTYTNLGHTLLHTPSFHLLILITFLIILPWLNLRRETFTLHLLSPHALRLQTKTTTHRFSVLAISTHPLGQYHPFATFPSNSDPQNDNPETSLVISAAGDWTKTQIAQAIHRTKFPSISTANSDPEKCDPATARFWVKGWPKPGVLSLTYIYPRVLIVTTGSGIAPALSSLLHKPSSQFVRLIWSTRAPEKTYGKELCKVVAEVDPQAVVIDTDLMKGRPDLLGISFREQRSVGAEAVFVLGNERVTRKVVYGLEARGVRAFGPVWDS